MKFFYSAFLAMMLSFFSLHGSIDKVQNMQELEQYFKSADSSTLAVFDIDYTLIQPKEPAFQAANMERFQTVLNKILQQLSPQKRDVLINLINIRTQPALIDRSTPQFFQQLNQRRIPFMGLTKDLTGPLGEINNMEDWKVQVLEGLGIDFSSGGVIKDKIIFTSMPSFRDSYPVYTDGILFANGSGSKGKMLVKFLTTFCLAPRKVIFVDYEEKNLIDVERALSQLDNTIEYQGLLFEGAQQVAGQQISEKQFKEKWDQMATQAQKLK